MAIAKAARHEFLILEVGEGRSPGSSFVLRAAADSEAKAMEAIQKLIIAGSIHLAIVETKGVFVREPVVNIKRVGESIIPSQA